MERTRVVAAVVERDGRLLVCKRPQHKRHGGLWEFPGGKVEPDEDDLAAVRRELHEELGVDVLSIGSEEFRMDDEGSHFTIVFMPTTISGQPAAIEHDEIAWAEPRDLLSFELAPSDLAFVRFRALPGSPG